MKKVDNVYGSGSIGSEQDIRGTVYTKCCACMNIYADYLSQANDKRMVGRFVSDDTAYSIVVLGCQLSDTAILNSLRHLENLMTKYPTKKFYVGGCLAKRFDVELPESVIRLDALMNENQWIISKKAVDYADPFWVENFDRTDQFTLDTNKYRFLYNQGHLFRNSYPLRIGGGCYLGSDICYKNFYFPTDDHKYNEFMTSKNPVIITGTMSNKEVFDWVHIAIDLKKRISFRNLSPSVVVEQLSYFSQLSDMGLIDIFHVAIHSDNDEVLADFGLDSNAVSEFLSSLKFFNTNKSILATTVFTGYKNLPNTTTDTLSKFDYVTSIPYWDGKWNRESAELRWKIHFPWSI